MELYIVRESVFKSESEFSYSAKVKCYIFNSLDEVKEHYRLMKEKKTDSEWFEEFSVYRYIIDDETNELLSAGFLGSSAYQGKEV